MEMVRWGYTTDSLSEACDISKPVLQGLLTNRAVTISTRNVYALARAFGYPVSDFIDLLHGTPVSPSRDPGD